jgi:hypothetical protein
VKIEVTLIIIGRAEKFAFFQSLCTSNEKDRMKTLAKERVRPLKKFKLYHSESCLNRRSFITWTSFFVNAYGYFVFRLKEENDA